MGSGRPCGGGCGAANRTVVLALSGQTSDECFTGSAADDCFAGIFCRGNPADCFRSAAANEGSDVCSRNAVSVVPCSFVPAFLQLHVDYLFDFVSSGRSCGMDRGRGSWQQEGEDSAGSFVWSCHFRDDGLLPGFPWSYLCDGTCSLPADACKRREGRQPEREEERKSLAFCAPNAACADSGSGFV